MNTAGARVFLTGATGFIGGRLARALAARGYDLCCLVRSPDRAHQLRELGADLVTGDTTDARAMRDGMAGARFAFHIAGLYDLGAVDHTAMVSTNIDGTRVFLDALRDSSVERAVYTSTTAALGPAADVGTDDDVWHGPYPSLYHRTKTEAHHIAIAAQRAGAPLVIVCPAFVYGPGDEGPAGRYVFDVLRHRVPGLSTRPAWFSYVHVDDVVAGMVAALERGRVGTTYVLSGEHASVNEYTRNLARAAGTWAPPLRVPPFMVRLTGALMDAAGKLFGTRLPISRELAAVAATGDRWLQSHERASRELGYSPRSLEAGLPETVRDARARLERG